MLLVLRILSLQIFAIADERTAAKGPSGDSKFTVKGPSGDSKFTAKGPSGDSKFAAEVLKVHSAARKERSASNMLHLTWDQELAGK